MKGGITDSRRLLSSLAAPCESVAGALFRLESLFRSEYEAKLGQLKPLISGSGGNPFEHVNGNEKVGHGNLTINCLLTKLSKFSLLPEINDFNSRDQNGSCPRGRIALAHGLTAEVTPV